MFLGKDYKVGKTNMPKANCHKLNGKKQQIAKRISTDPKANSSTKPSSAQFFMEITDLTVKGASKFSSWNIFIRSRSSYGMLLAMTAASQAK